MTYREIYEKALDDLEHNKITLGEFEERVKPLNQEPTNVVEELEKIKSELLSHTGGSNIFGSLYVDVKDINRVFDRRITELKGENKSEQSDTEFNHEAFYEYLLNVINPNEMENYRSMFLSNGEIVN